MAIKGGKNVRQNSARLFQGLRGKVTRRAIEQITIAGEANAISMTPVDTANLVNSRYREVKSEGTRYRGRVGFTADYAEFVHNAPGKLKGLPRSSHNGRARGNYWDPDGEPEFLRKGFEDEDAQSQFRKILRLEYRK